MTQVICTTVESWEYEVLGADILNISNINVKEAREAIYDN